MKNIFSLCLLILSLSFFDVKSQKSWTDISTSWISSIDIVQKSPAYNIGCSGVIVNRLTGDVVINITGYGLWKSLDQGETFVRIDKNTVGGRNESAWAIQYDQDNPKRMANFSVDGKAAYTPDGINWQRMTTTGRNWDMGAVDWSSPDAQVILAARHEYNGELDLSLDGGLTWQILEIRAEMSNSSGVMIGVIDSTTLLYSNNNGINRSTDQGVTWTKVSSAVTRSKVAVMFKGVCYLGTTDGLLVSKDKGATWEKQGLIDILQGPQFGADENTMVIVNTQGMYKSIDAGKTWVLIAPLLYVQSAYSIQNASWFGHYVWDPIHNVCYATAISNPAYKIGALVTPTGVTINPANATIAVGTKTTFTATMAPANAGGHINWSSSDSTVAKVINGIVTGIKAGTCNISATTSIYGKTSSCEVTITQEVTSINNITSQLLSIYPNPSAGIINISGNNIHKSEVFGLNGNSYGFYYGNVIDLSSLLAGTYVINVYDAKGSLLKTTEIVLSK